MIIIDLDKDYTEEMYDDFNDYDLYDDAEICTICGSIYCSCCGCDCLFEDLEDR